MPFRSVLLAIALAVGLAACGADDEPSLSPPVRATASHDAPAADLFLRNVWENSITAVDVGTGESTTVSLPQLAPGDPLYHLVQTGGKLVFYGRTATFALDPDLRSSPRNLGESWYFVPSATEGRVWLAVLDPESPDTVRALQAVREVTVDGRVTVPDASLPPGRWSTLVGAVEDGLLFQDDGLVVWAPATGRVILRLPGSFPADTHGNLVAWCRQECPEMHLTEVASGEDVVVPPDGFHFEETYDGAFSPDGSLLALPVVTRDGHQVALVDVAERTARLIPRSELAHPYLAITWSPSGDRVFFSAGRGRIMAYRPGSEEATILPVRVDEEFVDMAAS